RRFRDGVGPVRGRAGLLGAAVPFAARSHGVLSVPTPSGPRMDPQRLIRAAALVALALLWLVPVVWVLVTSLKLSENIVRLPPEWIPWPATGSHYYEVLFSSSRTA